MLTDLVVPVLTPFTGDEVDGEAMAAHCSWIVAQGASGVMLFGTTGEGPSLSVTEKIAAAGDLVERAPGLPIVAAITETSWTAARDCVAGYNDLPLAAVLALPPFYFREQATAGITAFLDRLVEQSRHPVLGYHIPHLAPGIPVDYVATSGLWGVKNSSADALYTDQVLAAGKAVFVGAEGLVAEAVAKGASGAIAGMGNLMPWHLAELCRRARRDDVAGAQELAAEVLQVQARVIAAAPELEFLSLFKALAGRLQQRALGDVRLPLRPARAGAFEAAWPALERSLLRAQLVAG